VAIFRWLLVLPLGATGVALGIFAGGLLHSAATWACPAAHLISGACMAPWFPVAEAMVMCAGAAIGAMAAVLLPSLAAPRGKRLVAVAAYLCGTAYATWLSLSVGEFLKLPYATALAVGALTAYLVNAQEK